MATGSCRVETRGDAFDVFTAPSLRGTAAERELIRVAYETTARHLADDGGERDEAHDGAGHDNGDCQPRPRQRRRPRAVPVPRVPEAV